ncbi:MAG: VOC family protein [Bacteroidales bacterium]
MKIEPFLIFDGDCSDAIAFYTKVFHGMQVKIQTYGDAKEHLAKEHIKVTPNWKDKIMHASFVMPDGNKIVMCDRREDAVFHQGNDSATVLEFEKPEDLDKIFHALSEGGKIDMPIQKKFWHAMYGEITDKFKKRWLLNCQIVSIND